jgi:membrane associated rhomboid family serine protease
VASSAKNSRSTRRGPGDPWFQIGTVDVTTSVLIPLIMVVVWVAGAVDAKILNVLWLSRAVYRVGFVWQLVTWPFASLASVNGAIGLFFFWSFGRILEGQLGPLRFLKMLGLITVVTGVAALLLDLVTSNPGALLALLARSNTQVLTALSSARFLPIVVGPSLVALGVAVAVSLEFPGIRAFFGIPIRFLVGAFVAIEALQTLGDRYRIHLAHLAIAIAVSVLALRSFGLGSELPAWIPHVPLPASWTGLRSSPSRNRGASGPSKLRGKRLGGNSVVTGPWGEKGTGTASPSAAPSGRSSAMTRADREEVDRLLDKIAQEGMGSLSSDEKAQLEDASRRLRETDNR